MAVPPTSPDPPPSALPAAGRPGSPVVAYAVIPLSSLLGIVLLAAVHQWLGAPLGEGFGADLWSMVKSGVFVIVPTYVGLAIGVQKHNARMEALHADRAHVIPAPAYEHPAASLTDGRRVPTGSHPALHPGASTTRSLVVVEPRAEGPDEE